MNISFSPQRRNDTLTIEKTGDTLNINSEDFDFTTLPDGATLPSGNSPSPWIVGPVHRIDGEIHLTLLLPLGPSATEEARFPEALIDVPDGPISLPGGDVDVDG